MQKIFKIERINNATEFKKAKHPARKSKRAKKAWKQKPNLGNKQLEQLITKQAKLHNEEKELLQKKEELWLTKKASPTEVYEWDNSFQLLRSDSVITLEQETKDTWPGANDNNEYQNCYSKIILTSLDAAIIEGLDFVVNAPLIRQIQESFMQERKTMLPPKLEHEPEYTLVLDLDETLVHWSISPFEGYDEVKENIYISYRPYLIDFLEKVSSYFEVVVFTASEKEYANMILDRIDPEHKYIQHRLYRDSCLPLNGNYIKDLTILGRDMNKTIIIDNSIIAFSLNLDNGILIHSFCGDKQDVELYKLIEILEYALDLSKSYPPNTLNLREYLISMFGLKERMSMHL